MGIDDLLLKPADRLLALIELVAVLAAIHEFVQVRRYGLATAKARWWTGLGVVVVAYVVSMVSFVAFAELAETESSSWQFFSSYLPSTVEASLWADVAATVVLFTFRFGTLCFQTSSVSCFFKCRPPSLFAHSLPFP